jgi:hypothetical protein
MLSAAAIARALGGKAMRRGGWIAKCPAHDDRTPSLSITDAPGGKVLLHCFSGCDALDVIEALRARGLWPERHPTPEERAALAAERRRRQEAERFCRAAAMLAELALQRLGPCDPERSEWTEILLDIEKNPLEFARHFQRNKPEMYAALLHAEERQYRRARRRTAEMLEAIAAQEDKNAAA